MVTVKPVSHVLFPSTSLPQPPPPAWIALLATPPTAQAQSTVTFLGALGALGALGVLHPVLVALHALVASTQLLQRRPPQLFAPLHSKK